MQNIQTYIYNEKKIPDQKNTTECDKRKSYRQQTSCDLYIF